MKSNVRVLLLALAALTLLGWYQVLGVTGENKASYENAVADAKRFTEEGAYEKAIDAYMEALGYGDNLEIRRSMNKLYLLCMEDGSTRYTISQYEKFLSAVISIYPAEAESYELSVEYWYEKGKYLKCYGILQKAEKNRVNSDTLKTYMDLVKYQCKLDNTRYTDFQPLTQGKMAVYTTDVWNYVNGLGNILLNGNYEEAQPFAEGIAIVRKNGTLRVITEDGTVQKILDEDILSAAGCYGNGMAPVQIAEGYIYIDSEGDKVLGPYDKASSFCNGVAAVMTGEQWQIIDTAGTVVLGGLENVILDGLGRCSGQNVILAFLDGSYSLYTLDGRRISNEGYEDADVFGTDGFLAVKKNGLWGYIDTEGNWVLEPQYRAAKSFSNGLAGVCIDDMWGFIDRSGKIVITCEYEDVDYWNEKGCCMVFEGDFWRLLKLVCI